VTDVLHGFAPTLLLDLKLTGTFVFGLSGGLAGVRKQLDVFGIVCHGDMPHCGWEHCSSVGAGALAKDPNAAWSAK
jgi:hypothetical protein